MLRRRVDLCIASKFSFLHSCTRVMAAYKFSTAEEESPYFMKYSDRCIASTSKVKKS